VADALWNEEHPAGSGAVETADTPSGKRHHPALVRAHTRAAARRRMHPCAVCTPAPMHPCAVCTLAQYAPLRSMHPCAVCSPAQYAPLRSMHPCADGSSGALVC
jgi:hypothetical protein